MKYGERLRAARRHAELTQQQLAAKIHNVCTQENISKLERSNATGSEFTAQFAEACGVRAMWLAAEEGDMIDGLYVYDQKIKHLVQICQELADYDVQRLVQAGDALKELTNKAKTPAKG